MMVEVAGDEIGERDRRDSGDANGRGTVNLRTFLLIMGCSSW
jgi:hypothetical protein